jgi:hypothetical protein
LQPTSSRTARAGCANKARAALRRHLDAQVGATRKVLSESRAIGHTEHFTPVRLDARSGPD